MKVARLPFPHALCDSYDSDGSKILCFLFAIVVRLGFFFVFENCGNLFFVLGSAVCMFVHPLTDRRSIHYNFVYIES